LLNTGLDEIWGSDPMDTDSFGICMPDNPYMLTQPHLLLQQQQQQFMMHSPPPQQQHLMSHPQSPASSTSETVGSVRVKTCSVCGVVNPKKIGHRLQTCDKRDHSDCQLVCNTCEDFFRRHSLNPPPQRSSCGTEPCSQKKQCQAHRYQRCLEVGMRQRDSGRTKDEMLPEPVVKVEPVSCDHCLPDWKSAINNFDNDSSRLYALCRSLSLSYDVIRQQFKCVEDVMKQPTEYSKLLATYPSDEAQAIRHECLSVQLLLESFWTFVETGFSAQETLEMGGQYRPNVPVCVSINYVAQKKVLVGRDIIPPQVDVTKVPMHPLAYEKYRESVPRQAFLIERRESTTTPPFAVGGTRSTARVIFFQVTSKLVRGTVLYLRKRGGKAIYPLQVDVAVTLTDGDTLSIYNEQSPTAELMAWRVTLSRADVPK
jgi:hypothetical protein